MKYEDKFKFHSFVSIQKTRNFPFQEWVGETKNDEIVIINYKENKLSIGTGNNELKARMNFELVGKTIVPNVSMTVERMNNELKLE